MPLDDHDDERLHLLGLQLAHQQGHAEAAIDGLATSHVDGIILEYLEGDN